MEISPFWPSFSSHLYLYGVQRLDRGIQRFNEKETDDNNIEIRLRLMGKNPIRWIRFYIGVKSNDRNLN